MIHKRSVQETWLSDTEVPEIKVVCRKGKISVMNIKGSDAQISNMSERQMDALYSLLKVVKEKELLK